MRLIADGAVDRDGVGGLARRLGYSDRQLNRLMSEELGAGPLAIARAQRAHTARLLIETTAMSFTDVAFAAGFGSVRQFNDTILEVFASSPSELRTSVRQHRAGSIETATTMVNLRLPTRAPFAGAELMSFVGSRAIPGIESWDGSTYRRTLALPGGHGVVELIAHPDHVAARVRLESWADLAAAVQRIRRLLDLDADPVAVDEALGADLRLGPLVERTPGRRAPGSVDPFETSVRAVIGQQVSVAGARTVAAQMIREVGGALAIEDHELTHVFPCADAVALVPDVALAMPTSRRETIRRLSAAVAEQSLELHEGVDPDVTRRSLVALKGIGPWTADYVVMRGLGHTDAFLATDLGIRHALDGLRIPKEHSAGWAPWRSYAVHHLWASLNQSVSSVAGQPASKKDSQ